jgi:hypothetical protein
MYMTTGIVRELALDPIVAVAPLVNVGQVTVVVGSFVGPAPEGGGALDPSCDEPASWVAPELLEELVPLELPEVVPVPEDDDCDEPDEPDEPVPPPPLDPLDPLEVPVLPEELFDCDPPPDELGPWSIGDPPLLPHAATAATAVRPTNPARVVVPLNRRGRFFIFPLHHLLARRPKIIAFGDSQRLCGLLRKLRDASRSTIEKGRKFVSLRRRIGP